jgi:hypothetical protein
MFSPLGQAVVVSPPSTLKPCGPSFICRGGIPKRALPTTKPVYPRIPPHEGLSLPCSICNLLGEIHLSHEEAGPLTRWQPLV